MKILHVIVDELPKGAFYCELGYKNIFLPTADNVETFCKLRMSSSLQKRIVAQTRLCPDCPLRLEHDNKQIANEVM